MPQRKGPRPETLAIKNARMKTSAWFVTINPHDSSKGMTEEAIEKKKQDYFEVLRNAFEENFSDYVVFVNRQYDPDLIYSVENYLVVEIQPVNKTRGFHSHNTIVIKHRTVIQLDYKELKSILRDALSTIEGVHNPRIKISLSDDNGEKEKIYMEKETGKCWTKEEVRDYYKQEDKTKIEENKFICP